MTKTILSIAITATLMLTVPAVSMAEPLIEIVDNYDFDMSGISISVEQNILHISGAAGEVVQIYNVAGVCVKTIKVDSDDKRYELNLTKGCYIVKVGKIVRKISVR